LLLRGSPFSLLPCAHASNSTPQTMHPAVHPAVLRYRLSFLPWDDTTTSVCAAFLCAFVLFTGQPALQHATAHTGSRCAGATHMPGLLGAHPWASPCHFLHAHHTVQTLPEGPSISNTLAHCSFAWPLTCQQTGKHYYRSLKPGEKRSQVDRQGRNAPCNPGVQQPPVANRCAGSGCIVLYSEMGNPAGIGLFKL
jgi:hypothetical protein